jgi:hypothetical protein
MYKGNATDQVLTNLNLENERKGLQDVSVFVKYSPFNLILVPLHYALLVL